MEERELKKLIEYPRESEEIEIKSWLDLNNNKDKANLAKAMIAISNYGGGFIIIGLEEGDNNFIPKETPGQEIFKLYNNDRLNGIVEKYADPSFHIECRFVEKESNTYPVIVIPGNQKVPIRTVRDGPEQAHIKKDSYYIRRPGPKSEEPQSGKEWSELIRKCTLADKERLVEQIREILIYHGENSMQDNLNTYDMNKEWFKESTERFYEKIKEDYNGISKSPLKYGYWRAAYAFVPEIDYDYSLSDFKNGLKNCKGDETGWPIGLFLNESYVYSHNGNVETWLGKFEPAGAGHCDFWRASPKGMFITFRGYQEDEETNSVGRGLDYILPIWRIGEFLLHAKRFSEEFIELQSNYKLFVTVKWTGLKDRRLTSTLSRYSSPLGENISQQDEVETEVVINEIENLIEVLPEKVYELVNPLHNAFQFFEVNKKTIIYELNKMRGIN